MYKQTIVVRKDLQMGSGKISAQVSHASVSGYNLVRKKYPEVAETWEQEGQKKVVLKVQSEGELLEYFQVVKEKGIPCQMIMDAGHTQVEPGTKTCFAAGPWEEDELDKIFGKLKLL